VATTERCAQAGTAPTSEKPLEQIAASYPLKIPGPVSTLEAMGERADHPLAALVEERRDDIKAAVRRHKGRTVALFGSVARGEDTPTSDIDFLVEFEPGSSLFDLLHLQDELAELLACSVDVVSSGGLKPRDQRIKAEALSL